MLTNSLICVSLVPSPRVYKLLVGREFLSLLYFLVQSQVERKHVIIGYFLIVGIVAPGELMGLTFPSNVPGSESVKVNDRSDLRRVPYLVRKPRGPLELSEM